MGQSNTVVDDDVYYKPGNANMQVSNQSQPDKQTHNTKGTPNYKNGAKEIIYIDPDNSKTKATHDTIYVVGEANDTTENNQEQGYYLNGFNGTESDLEYAERIRRFHNPKYEIFVGDPRYNDIYFLDSFNWNVYIDGSYAYVTPTWSNPYWFNYNFNPYSYSNWGFGFNNYFSPWGYDNFYGGFGYGGYGYNGFGYGGYGYGGFGYGYGNYYGYNGYGGYYGYGGSYSGGSHYGNHKDADDRLRVGITSRATGTSASSKETTNPYTTIGGSSNLSRSGNTSVIGGVNTVSRTTARTVSLGTGSVRNTYTTRNLNSGIKGTSYTTTIRTGAPMINTNPRTTNYNSNNLNNSSTRSYNNISSNTRNNSSVTNSRNTSTNGSSTRSNYSSGNNPTYNSSSNNSGSNTRSSSPSYSAPTYSSGSSSSGGSSDGGSRSSGGGGGRR